MVQYQQERIDRAFGALADPTRRAVLERLAHSGATISELAAPFGMSLTGMKKHVAILEEAGLVRSEKVGRERRCRLDPVGPTDAAHWMEMHRATLEARLDRFEQMLQNTGRKDR
ncbi:MAG: metalloregulator ArsR/SmtB family transcription factor [Actinomycetota bacterium]|nr:metalloregulator ArsR/SmtB family transcription factor [Actinomycetota bacterium]